LHGQAVQLKRVLRYRRLNLKALAANFVAKKEVLGVGMAFGKDDSRSSGLVERATARSIS